MHYKQKLTENRENLSKTWKIINEIINKTEVKTTVPPLATSTNASNPLDVVNTSNILNDYFVEVGPTLASSVPPTVQVTHTSSSSVVHSFFPEEVVLQVYLLNPSKYNDTYDLPASSLNISKHVIVPSLADLHNLCI